MAWAEEQATAMGCQSVVVDTMSFEAQDITEVRIQPVWRDLRQL